MFADHYLITKYKFIEKIAALHFVEKIFLYGSRARGDNHEKSDIDLAIYCPGANLSDWILVLDIVEDTDTLLKIDCVRLDNLKETNPLKQSILNDKVLLYQKD